MREKSPNKQVKKQVANSNRRKLVVGGLAISASSALTQWTNPIINSVILPAHAQTSNQEPVAPPTTPPATDEVFGATLQLSDGIGNDTEVEFFVSVSNGTFTIQVFGFNPNTDLFKGIYYGTVSEVGQVTSGTWAECQNDGTESAFPFSVSFQVISYTAGVNVVIQLENATSYTIPLNNSATPPSCPIL